MKKSLITFCLCFPATLFLCAQTNTYPFPASGNVGIGTSNPSSKLHVRNGNNSYGTILADADEIEFSLYSKTLNTAVFAEAFRLGLKYGNNENNGYISFYRGPSVSGGFLGFSTNGLERIRIHENGNVGIGTIDTKGFKLGVLGKIVAQEIKVASFNNWPDFVFKNNYNLPNLKEVEQHLSEKGHLHNIPSADEVKENGFFLGEMDSKLLQKIEELTLYAIQQEKRLDLLENQAKTLDSLEERIAQLEEKITLLLNNKKAYKH